MEVISLHKHDIILFSLFCGLFYEFSPLGEWWCFDHFPYWPSQKRTKWCPWFHKENMKCIFNYLWGLTYASYRKWGYDSWNVTQHVVLVYRRGMKGCFTNFSLIMLRNCSQLYILQLLVRLARNMGASTDVLRVFTLVWKRSINFIFPVFVCNFKLHLVHGYIAVGLLQGEDPWGFKKLAWEEYSSYCCNWWWEDFGAWGSWMSGTSAWESKFLIYNQNIEMEKVDFLAFN